MTSSSTAPSNGGFETSFEAILAQKLAAQSFTETEEGHHDLAEMHHFCRERMGSGSACTRIQGQATDACRACLLRFQQTHGNRLPAIPSGSEFTAFKS